jgi:hypothetical protein
MWYPVVFLVSMGVDLIPIAAPPAWTLMVFFLVKFDLNPSCLRRSRLHVRKIFF